MRYAGIAPPKMAFAEFNNTFNLFQEELIAFDMKALANDEIYFDMSGFRHMCVN